MMGMMKDSWKRYLEESLRDLTVPVGCARETLNRETLESGSGENDKSKTLS